jgi:hypothetical protein
LLFSLPSSHFCFKTVGSTVEGRRARHLEGRLGRAQAVRALLQLLRLHLVEVHALEVPRSDAHWREAVCLFVL